MKTPIAFFVAIFTLISAHGAVKPGKEKISLPAIWKEAPPAERLKAVRAAELDATRLLVERIYGLSLDGDTTVHDLALESDEVNGAVQATIRGVMTTGKPEYLEDGIVQVVRAVTIREIIETITKTKIGKKYSNGEIKLDSATATRTVKANDKVIDVMGNAALPGSPGHKKVLAKRAAEIDAYRRLAERIMGVNITSTTTVRDFVVADDTILASLAASLKAATPTEINYLDDNSCEVTMELTMAEVIRSMFRHSDKNSETISIDDKIKQSVFSETGSGAPRPPEKKPTPAKTASPGGVTWKRN